MGGNDWGGTIGNSNAVGHGAPRGSANAVGCGPSMRSNANAKGPVRAPAACAVGTNTNPGRRTNEASRTARFKKSDAKFTVPSVEDFFTKKRRFDDPDGPGGFGGSGGGGIGGGGGIADRSVTIISDWRGREEEERRPSHAPPPIPRAAGLALWV